LNNYFYHKFSSRFNGGWPRLSGDGVVDFFGYFNQPPPPIGVLPAKAGQALLQKEDRAKLK